MSNTDDHSKFFKQEFWDRNRYYVWIFGLILRLIVTPFGLNTHDYHDFRLPVAIGLAKGGGLYNDVHYNQMPIYPYITALMVMLVGTNNLIFTGIAIKLPLAVADACVPIIIYKIGLRLNKSKEGLITSIFYAINPISILEVYWARWDGFASLIVFIAFYYMLQNRPYHFGVFISLGFLLKEFPLFLFGIAIVYWQKDWRKIIKSISTFITSTLFIFGLVMIPYGTTLNQVIDDLLGHPIYKVSFVTIIPSFSEIAELIWVSLWFIIFMTIEIIPLIIYYRDPDESIIIDVITLQMTFLSIFFINTHCQFLLWLLPWLIFWGMIKGRNASLSPIFLIIGYFLLRFGIDLLIFPLQLLGAIILVIIGIWITNQILLKTFLRRLSCLGIRLDE
jgi:hypothetical protein